MEIIIVSLLVMADLKAARREKTPVYQIMESFVRQAVARGAANEIIHTKVSNPAKSQ